MSSKYRSLGKDQARVLSTDFLEQVGTQPVEVVIDNQVEEILFRFTKELVEDIRKSIIDKDLDASGFLLSSLFDPAPRQLANGLYSVELKMADYWEDVENGQPRGTVVAVEDIMDWIANKGIDVRKQKGKSSIEQNKNLALKVKSAIYEYGTIKRFNYKGSKFLSEVVNDETMRDLGFLIGELLGKTVAVSFATSFNADNVKGI